MSTTSRGSLYSGNDNRCIMNRTAFLFFAAAAFFAVSCGPTYFSLGVEMRRPSRSGVDLDGKNISVTYLDKGEDSLFISSVAEGFTEALEKDFFAGEQKVGMYSIDAVEGVDYTCRDSMVSLLMDTGVDVAFLFDLKSMDRPEDSVPDIPFEVDLYVYDAMNLNDTVQMFSGDSALSQASDMSEQGLETGRRCARIFVSAWTDQRFVFYYYDASDAWCRAAEYASDYRFKDAVDIWMGLLDTGNIRKRACAEYNIAAACCIMGEKDLAVQWLDRADSDCFIPYSYTLRTRINDL